MYPLHGGPGLVSMEILPSHLLYPVPAVMGEGWVGRGAWAAGLDLVALEMEGDMAAGAAWKPSLPGPQAIFCLPVP